MNCNHSTESENQHERYDRDFPSNEKTGEIEDLKNGK